jgi:dUTP pyrophosphatase
MSNEDNINNVENSDGGFFHFINNNIVNMFSSNSLESLYNRLKNNFNGSSQNFAILKLAISDNELRTAYEPRIVAHNDAFMNNKFADSGFDLLVPSSVEFEKPFLSKFIDMKVKGEMIYCDIENNVLTTCAYVMHPRSSISKTPLMLANNTGIIDSGYRGSLIGAFRCLDTTYDVDAHTRLVQICHPTLCPVYVLLVDEKELSESERGSGGFGSTK